MRLKAIYTSQEDIPEQYRDLFTERNGQWELTGVEGLKTQADVERVQVGAQKEREEHAKTKATLKNYTDAFGERTVEEIQTDLDRIPELEAGGGGEVDQSKIDALVEARVNKATAPLERQIKTLSETNETLATENTNFKTENTTRSVRDGITKAATEAKVESGALEDILMYHSLFEIDDTGEVVTKDGVGVTPGLTPAVWMTDMKEKRAHWWGPSQGGGAGGADGKGGGAENPFSSKNWNLTKQGEMIKKDRATAERMAANAGTTIGGRRPVAS